jgi:hypothetical protein
MAGGQPVEVEIRVAEDGTITPLRFTWRGVTLRVAGVGRSWSDAAGDHWLVMTAPPEQAFELLRAPDGTWQATGGGSRPALA